MTNVRRLLTVASGLAVTAVLSAQLWGEPGDGQVRRSVLPGDGSRPAGKGSDPESALARSKFDQGGVLTYQPAEGDRYWAMAVQPKLDPVPRRPRDYVILVSTAAGQAGAAWTAARQLTEAVIKDAGPLDRVNVWTIGTPEEKFTRSLTGEFLSPKADDKKIQSALERLAAQFPAGDTDLKDGLTKAVRSFGADGGNQRVLLYLGDGLSTHTPLAAADRTALIKEMVEQKINFFAIPLGQKFRPENLHGFATGTGGGVVRVQLLDETLPDAMKRVEAAFAAPVLYPSAVQMPAGVAEFYPAKLPPLRPDAPTLVIGRMKAAKELSFTIKGVIPGPAGQVSHVVTEPVREPEVDNFFLVSMATQWAKARDQHALIRADRALAFAYEKNRLDWQEALGGAATALQDKNLEAAAQLFKQAQALNPADRDAAAGIKMVASVREGKITVDALRDQLGRQDRQATRIESKNGTVRTVKGQMVALLQDVEKNQKAQAAPAAGAQQPGPDDLLKAHRDRMIVEEQKLSDGIEGSMRQARRELNLDPDSAYETLKSALLRVRDHPDLGERVREDLTRRLQNQLRDIQLQGARVKLRRAEDQKVVAVAMANLNAETQRQAEQDRFEARFRVYKNLLNAARFERYAHEKLLAGLDEMQRDAALQGRPVPQVTQVAYAQASASYNLEVQRDLRRKRELGFLAVLLEVEKSHIPYPDEPPIHFPPIATWRALSKLRKEKYEVTNLPDDPEGRIQAQRIEKLLGETIDMKDFQTPMTLKEALGLFQDKLAAKYKEDDVLPILVDDAAFKEENADAPDIYLTEVKFPPFPRRMSVATALRIALSKVPTNNATYLIRRNFIEVTTVERQARERVLAVYPVGDLVIPIASPRNPFANMGMNGAMGGGFGFPGSFAGGGFPGMFGGGMGGMGMGGMGMGGMGMPGMMGMGGMGMGGMGMGMPGMGMGMPGMGMGGMGMGMPGMGMGMPGMGMGMGMPGMNIPGQNCLGFNQFNGGLGAVGSTMNQGLILLIQQLVAPGEWGQSKCMTQYNFPGMPGMGAGGIPGGPPQPVGEGGPTGDIANSNTIGFYAPALALVVRGTSRIHYKQTGGIMGGAKSKPKEVGFNDGQIAANKKAGNVDVAAGAGEDNDPLKRKKTGTTPVIAADADPRKIWQDALAGGVENPGIVIAAADFLFERGLYDHAAEFLKANLRQGVLVRPWVYEALAIAMEANGDAPDEIRRVRLSGIALDPQDAGGFMKAARAMAEHKEWDRAVAFCKKAAELDPNSPHPYAEALAFAEVGKDSRGMEWAASHLLSQEWTSDSRDLHLKAQARLDLLATRLDAEQRGADAARLRASLQNALRRDLIINLSWEAGRSGPADVALEVKEPTGSVCSWEHRQSPGGGTWTGDLLTGKTQSSYTAAQAFSGTYEVTIRRIWGEPLGGNARLTIIQHQGTPQEVRRLESVKVDNKVTLKITMKDGRRTDLAVVSATDLAKPTVRSEEVKEQRIYDVLRDIADPFYTGPTQAMRGSAGSGHGAAEEIAPLSRQAAMQMSSGRGQERKAAEFLAFQTAIAPASGSGVNVSASATVSPDQQYMRLRLTPVFQTSGSTMPAPVGNAPLIPGGANP